MCLIDVFKNFGLSLLVLSAIIGNVSVAQAQTIDGSLSLSLNIELAKNLRLKPHEFQKTCKYLQSVFSFESNIWGNGLFDIVQCGVGKRKAGLKPKKSKQKLLLPQLWRLKIYRKKRQTKMVMSAFLGNKWLRLAKLSVDYERSKLLLASEPSVQMLGLSLRDQLPIFSRLKQKLAEFKDFEKGDLIKINNPDKIEVRPYEKIYLYTVRYNRKTKVWVPLWLGGAKYAKNKGGWEITEIANLDSIGDIGGPVFLHHKEGPDQFAKVWQEQLEDYELPVVKNLVNSLTRSVSSGYAGLRFGLPRSIGLLLESRDGLLGGVRFYADHFLKIPSESDDAPLRGYQATKIALGYGFGLDIEATKTRFEIVPRIGMQKFRVEVLSFDGQYELFELPNALYLSLGAAMVQDLFEIAFMRINYNQDFIISLDQGESGERAFGVDLFFKGPQISKVFNLGFLLYGQQSTTEFVQKSTTRNDIVFSQQYYGLGVTLAW